MDDNYKKILEFMQEAGSRLREKAGKVADIGITKSDLTEEDLSIERGFKEIISQFPGQHLLYAEEENDSFLNADNVWVVDPQAGQPACISVADFYHRATPGKIEYFVDKKAETFPYSPTRCSIRIEKGMDGTLSIAAPSDMQKMGDEIATPESLNLLKIDKQDFTAVRQSG